MQNYNIGPAMFKRLFIIVLITSLAASCVPNKNLIYFQGEPVDNKVVKQLNDQPYKLQVHDVLTIEVKAKEDNYVEMFKKALATGAVAAGGSGELFNRNNLIDGYTVNRSGVIRVPYFGDINVLGNTTNEVREKLDQKYLTVFNSKDDFFVSVKLVGIKYTITGEINQPGPKVINLNRVNIVDAISFAGEIKETGDRRNVELWRNTDAGMKKYTIDLTKSEAFGSEIFNIQPNDLISIRPLKQKAWGTGITGIESLSTVVSALTLVVSIILLSRNL